MSIRVNATRRYTITIETTLNQVSNVVSEADYVELAESITGHELDSPDAGDATGAFIAYADGMSDDDHDNGPIMVSGNGITVIIESELDLFTWEGKLS